MRKIFALSILFTVLLSQLSAQTVTVYDSFNATKTIDPKRDQKSSVNNNVQWNYTLLTRGALAFTYERRINDYLSFEVGAGPTLYYDFAFLLVNESFRNSMGMDEFFGRDGDLKHQYSPGLFLSGAAKIYPKQMDSFEGFYVAPTYRYRTYNFTTTATDWGYGSAANREYSHKRSLKSTDMAFIVGYQWETWSELIISTYFGVGWSMKSYDMIDSEQPSRMVKVEEGLPIFMYGATFGFAF